MSLKISNTNTPTYDYWSEGTGANPGASSASADGSGGTVNGDVVTAYLVAVGNSYSGISVAPANEETGINWQVSLDGATWGVTVYPSAMDATSADQVITLYFRPVVTNDGSVPPGLYTACNVQVAATVVA